MSSGAFIKAPGSELGEESLATQGQKTACNVYKPVFTKQLKRNRGVKIPSRQWETQSIHIRVWVVHVVRSFERRPH